MLRAAVFASGEGTNLQSLLDAAKRPGFPAAVVLVVASKPEAGALKRAEKAGIETLCVAPKDFPTPEAFSARLAAECSKRSVDLICLAGFLPKLAAPLLEAYPDRVLNVHPSLLPAFGGKGFYGLRVHEAVLKAGVQVTGCTVHLVDDRYDHGPIVLQTCVSVLPGDTADLLARRVLAREHQLYPEALRLFGEGRIRMECGLVRILPLKTPPRTRRALLSVSDKTGLADFARGLEHLGIEIVSTSGTARALQEAGVAVRPLESLTGFPEILGGRVKTLHPRVHGGILMRRSEESDLREASVHGIEPIDLVAVNLYPFEEAARAAAPFSPQAVENIDIGGVALLRAAAKNFPDVAVVVSPQDYPTVLEELGRAGALSQTTRQELSRKAFEHTARYDATIARKWAAESPSALPGVLELRLEKTLPLRYGENPHQKAALYEPAGGEPGFEQLHGKELSYNNLLDAFGAWEAACEFEDPAVVLFKHVTPCGAATGKTLADALAKAWACDPASAFGGVLAFTRPVDVAVAKALLKRFVEVLAAPSFEPVALDILQKKPNLRLVAMKARPGSELTFRSLGRGVLACEPDRLLLGPDWKVVTARKPSEAEERALRFAWAVCKHVRSNAIVLAGPSASVGIGAGQMSRVDSVRVAAGKYAAYRTESLPPEALALASDAFFPFADGIEEAAKAGATAIIQPGGSVRDAEVVAAADKHKLAMVFTGVRHFRH
ncbi:MAG TPA: bifunctional phosphoribosylaminoimidazolecarboxamide formyltransferase/inosine monophosphate cyclohydrolase [Elusimicrobia bacterium]|nr:bifunctional phosphoribosylaminoimidazolecarboxamide formyltransferase/inosine monophosphate cyclohydrolase [Elusimicrobiota bacterium]